MDEQVYNIVVPSVFVTMSALKFGAIGFLVTRHMIRKYQLENGRCTEALNQFETEAKEELGLYYHLIEPGCRLARKVYKV